MIAGVSSLRPRKKRWLLAEEDIMEQNNVEVLDSREVAKMMGKEHKELLRDIRGGGEKQRCYTNLNKGRHEH